jgi:amino-acid N-acetyltransferase
MPTSQNNSFVDWFRDSSPYIHAHRGKTFVIAFEGEAVASECFTNLVHDIALLQGLGIRLVLVHGARPQIEENLRSRNIEMQYANGLRITDDETLKSVKEGVSLVRLEVEARLSLGLANSPMAGTRIRVASGNFVTAKPLGVLDGIDHGYTGEVRRVDAAAITQQLDNGNIVLLSPLGYSPTGEIFNLSSTDVANRVAIRLNAEKLIYLTEEKELVRRRNGSNHLSPAEIEDFVKRRKSLSEKIGHKLRNAADACRSGVKRAHIVDGTIDGALLRELFTRDGAGYLITAEAYESIRPAKIDDVTGIIELIEPLENRGVLVKRSREILETEVDNFVVLDRDGMITGCAALYEFPDSGMAELACIVVHPNYQSDGKGDMLIEYMEKRARQHDIKQLFVLTTQTLHWFQERGFKRADISILPKKKRDLYNFRRNSRVAVKSL